MNGMIFGPISTAVLSFISFLGALNVASGVEEQSADAEDGLQFFSEQVLPILEEHCYSCHSHKAERAKGGLVLDSRAGWEQGGSEGPAVIRGRPDESLLMQAVRYEGYEMPPDGQLSAAEISILERWIASGAPDDRESQAPVRDPASLWALQPILVSPLPETSQPDWIRDELDAFVLSQLEQHGLSPATDAERHVLLRRVTFDLTGLPPTVAEIESFVSDQAPDAYTKVVDRLLDSAGFGDHWARHWFDLSCYADLADIQGNVLIREAWRYRDYMIESMNADVPFDTMILEQIAGDLLPWETVEQRRRQIIATGFLAIGPWTLQNYIKKQLDADVVDHQIDRIGRIFLGQTLSCARCHDHKFDPIPTADYHALAGIFHSTRTTSYDGPGVWSVINETALPSLNQTEEERQKRTAVQQDLQGQQAELQQRLTGLLMEIPGTTDANWLISSPLAANETDQQYELSFRAGPSVWAGASQATAAGDGLRIDLLRPDGTVFRTWVHEPLIWSGEANAQVLQPVLFSYQGEGSGPLRIRLTSSKPGSGRFGGAVDDLRIRSAAAIVFEEDFSGLRPGSIRGTQAATGLTVLAQASVPGWEGGGINFTHAVDLGDGNYAVQFFGGTLRGLENARAQTDAERDALAKAKATSGQLKKVYSQLEQLEQQELPQYALAVQDVAQPADSPIYRRGNWQSPGEIVARGFPAAIPVSRSHSISPAVSGREQLAYWLTDPGNPLTPRVLVNRIWHHLFGSGLVKSVDYFGVHGERPSHPELLDFLASRMCGEDRWSLKATIRRMVLSRTYQMSAAANPAAATIDPENRLLWRMPRRRLPAEAIRDAMLAVSGQLDPARGGPSLGLELPGNISGAGGNVNPANWGGKISDLVRHRRTVYLPLRRERPQGELEILSVFDFPHPSDITGARSQTTVATQALFLLNSGFVKEQAAEFAKRLQRDYPDNDQTRIQGLYLLALGRPAVGVEIEQALEFLAADGQKDVQPAGAAWTELCHAVLGSNSFLFCE